MKDADEMSLEQTARIVREMCSEVNATFIIDDNVPMARKVGADGVHLGKNDMPVAEARKLLGSEYIIGGTVNTFADIESMHRSGAVDYLGCGPFRFTSTKKNLSPVLGIAGYRSVVAMMREAGIRIPIVAIGGICKEDVRQLLEVGVDGIALSSSVLCADDPVEEMRRIVAIVNEFSE